MTTTITAYPPMSIVRGLVMRGSISEVHVWYDWEHCLWFTTAYDDEGNPVPHVEGFGAPDGYHDKTAADRAARRLLSEYAATYVAFDKRGDEVERRAPS